uniref:(California timema) hypothetical protein n=1 Tax=Timema californicum TaxID=61474 RepID=A0A7R9JM63_TIMCA|nr:unnamed protein product [Timema californicum]
MPGCCYQVGLKAEAKAGLVGVGLRTEAKVGLVAATRWGWLLLPENARILLSGGAEDRGQAGDGGSD